MANWHPRLLQFASWLFPFVAGAVGLYAASSAGGNPIFVLVAATALVIGSMLNVATSNSGNHFTMGLAVAAAIPFVFSSLEMVEPSGSIAAFGLGLAVVWAFRHSRGERHHDLLPVMVRRFGGYVVYAIVYSEMRVGLFADLDGGWEDLFPFAAAVAAWLGVEVVIRAMFVLGPRELSRSYLARSFLHDLNVFMGLALTGALFGELFPPIAWWALPIALLPYSFAHSAFKRFQETKTTYRQTIRALARIPEVSGLGIDGHADRTTEIATSIAKELGLGPSQVDEVEYAALMHDIGRVSLSEPQILKMGYTEDDLARWSAEIIAESPYLERVAEQVRHQYDAYRKPGEQHDPEISVVSRIIKVAAAYDWKVHKTGMSPLAALEELHAGAAYDFDPEVVASLRRLLEARGVLRTSRVKAAAASSSNE
ncbi:MAG TPA: HD domain-containing phosphohydrolase [Acidimicrobiia bacterium]|nr:HD domain-containing phosphohydrolase [Acidimicrobiia bacterium]